MPKDTFFNLPEAKREAITEIAIEEFSDHAYGDVSISRIVARAGIAKGSFYQYFEDKDDLYGHLLQMIIERKREMFSLDHPDPQHVGVFEYMRWIAANGARFEQAYPKLSRLAYRAFSANTMPQSFQETSRRETMAFFRRLVALGQAQGDISPDINADLAASIFDLVLASMGQMLGKYMLNADTQDVVDEPIFDQPEIIHLYCQAIDILEHGLRRAPVPQQMQATEAVQEAETI